MLARDLLKHTVFGVLCVAGPGLSFIFLALPQHPPWELRPVWRLGGVQDATAFPSGAELLGTKGLYQAEAVVAVQERSTGTRSTGRLFLRPPWFTFTVRWMAFIRYRVAIGSWKVLLLVGGGLFVMLWPTDRQASILALCWSAPMAPAVEKGQHTVWILVLLAAALRLIQAGRWRWAGGCLALCTFKFHFLVLLPLLRRGWERSEAPESARVFGRCAILTTVCGE